MKKIIGLAVLVLIAFQTQAGLELKQNYGVWEHYETNNGSNGKAIVIGLSDVKSNGNVTTAALRCTNEGVNILFFKSLFRNEPGYMATSRIDDGEGFDMDVWIKGTTHWVTIPDEQLEVFKTGRVLMVTLEGTDNKEMVRVSLDGFDKMYENLIPSCEV